MRDNHCAKCPEERRGTGTGKREMCEEQSCTVELRKEARAGLCHRELLQNEDPGPVLSTRPIGPIVGDLRDFINPSCGY